MSRRALFWIGPALGACASAAGADFLMRSSPAPTFVEPPKPEYNLHWGPLTGRLNGSVQAEYNDNIGLDETNTRADTFFYPNFGVGFQWPLSPQNILEFNLGLGYRVYLENSELNSFSISPDSRILYQIRVGKVNVLLRDTFNLQVDPLSRPDISGGSGGTLLNFKRINNDVGVQAEWQARSNLALVSSYDYVIDRSLNSQFAALDRDDHNLAVGAYTDLGAAWNVGLNASTTLTDYLEPIQNDGVSFSAGPSATVKITRFITLDGSISYTRSYYDEASGAIADQSDFSGISASIGVRHQVNSKLAHNARFSRSISPGFGSNFNELSVLQYGLNWQFNSFIALNTTLSYERLNASGPAGETADRYLWYIGTGWQVARRWNLGVGYSFAWKDSDQPSRDYRQNRATLSLTHDF